MTEEDNDDFSDIFFNDNIFWYCRFERKWWTFVLSSILTFSAGLFIVLVFRLLARLCRAKENGSKPGEPNSKYPVKKKGKVGIIVRIKDWTGKLIAGETIAGKILVILLFLSNMVSLLIYVIDAAIIEEVEGCYPFANNGSLQIDSGLNLFFLIYFLLRLIAANDKLWYMFELHSLVDFLTIPPTILSVYSGRTWTGLRFMRAYYMMLLPDILQYFKILKTCSSIRLAKLLSLVVGVWLSAAGFLHLLENSTKGFLVYDGTGLGYFSCVYLIVTMSTIGYGDIYCKTNLGRLFLILFIIIGLVLFASCIPEILEIIRGRPKYKGRYHQPYSKRHIVLCGHVNYDNVSSFLREFRHEDRKNLDVDVVILSEQTPDLQYKSIFEKCHSSVEFFQGTAMNSVDLQNVKISKADACLILANKCCLNPDTEDAANIMRAISVKNTSNNTRIIIQLMHHHNKEYLLNIPSWNQKKGDEVICFAELKFGLIAQSCLAPGFATLIANLLTTKSYAKESSRPKWQDHYMRGAGMDIYTETMSEAFVGMSFPQAAELCFVKLNLLLLAVEISQGKYVDSEIHINPKRKVKLIPNTQGFFIAQHVDEVKRVRHYCEKCHQNVKTLEQIKKCKCKFHSITNTVTKRSSEKKSDDKGKDLEFERIEIKYDFTGMFHWCPAQSLDDCLLDRSRTPINIKDHVVICLFAEKQSPLIGLRNLVMPLRASNLHYHELKHVVIVGNAEYLEKEWKMLHNFPKISILNGSPLDHEDLRAVNINFCDMCVILSAKTSISEDPVLADKEGILTYLKIIAMKFDKELENRNSWEDGNSPLGNPIVPQKRPFYGKCVPVITELVNDANVQFLFQDDDNDTDSELSFSQPFACGAAIAVSVLDSLICTTYSSPNTLKLIRCLITGGSSPELERILAQGAQLSGGSGTPNLLENRDRCRVREMSLSDGPLASYREGGKYGDMFLEALKNYGMLCVGLHRYKDENLRPSNLHYVPDNLLHASTRRYVITNPPEDFLLIPTDTVFVLMQFDPALEFQNQ